MQPKNRIAIIIPCYNEEGRIGSVIKSIITHLPNADIIVIDDKSSDKSTKEVAEAGAIVLPLPVNLGYGAALETGYSYAKNNNYDFILQMDGDGQHLAEELTALIKPLVSSEADIVIGSRYLNSNDYKDTSTIRRLGQKLFSLILIFITGKRFSDPTSGFQGLNRRAFTFLSSGVFPCDYPDTDVLLMSNMAGFKIVEVPVKMKARVGGKSMHSGLKPIYYGMKMFLSIFIVMLNYKVWNKWKKEK